MRRFRFPPLLGVAVMVIAGLCFSVPALWALDVSPVVAWYDTLGFPDVTKLPYVRVATGSWIQSGNNPPENRYVEGFLVGEEPGAFTVFICSVSHFAKNDFGMDEPHQALTTVRFVRKDQGPEHERVSFEVLDFPKVAADVLERVRAQMHPRADFDGGLQWGAPPGHRARLFAFARACQQKGLAEISDALMDIAANIPDEQTGKPEPGKLRDFLQQKIGEATLEKAERDMGNPANSWEKLLEAFEHFDTRFPASPKVGYAQESAKLLRKMIAEEAAHHPKPLEQMTPAEKAAEYIYQLRNLGYVMWSINGKYPCDAWKDGHDVITPVHHLVDLGNVAVPLLIEALDDRRFTRCEFMSFHMQSPPRIMRVADVAQSILEFEAGRSFYQNRTEDGGAIGPITKELARAWWKEVKAKSEKRVLAEATAAGGREGCRAANKLVEKYPEAAIAAIEAGLRATAAPGLCGEMVEAAGKIPGNAPVAFLRSQLDSKNGTYALVEAATALFSRGQPGAVAPMIAVWKKLQRRLPTNQSDAYSEAGEVINFLAASGDAKAIAALEVESQRDPVEVRLAVVQVFLPAASGTGGYSGPSINVDRPMDRPPRGELGTAAEHLLVSALADSERRFGMKGTYGELSFEDPRVCDMAAHVLALRWPRKYSFRWAANPVECDVQILPMRNHWRSEHGLPPVAPPVPVVIPAAKETDIAPVLDEFAAASDNGARQAVSDRIVERFGLAALPAVRTRFDTSKDANFRALTVRLAGGVREVRVAADAPPEGATILTALQGHSLTGADVHALADELQSTLPTDKIAVNVQIQRSGNGTGFVVSAEWLPGKMSRQAGWKREQVVRCANQTLLADFNYMAEGRDGKKEIYEKLEEAFEKAIQSDIDSPVTALVRIQRSNGDD